MITVKKSYAEQMLQIALALSFLHVNPENYLDRRWDSQNEIRNGDGWQMEMLQAVPVYEYPYANGKMMLPLIEDLVRFDRQTNIYNVTAYLLNTQDSQNEQSKESSQEQESSSLQVPSESNNNTQNAELDVFLNADHFQDSVSIFDQNLADLKEYDDDTSLNFAHLNFPNKNQPSTSNDLNKSKESSAGSIKPQQPNNLDINSMSTTTENKAELLYVDSSNSDYNSSDVVLSSFELLNEEREIVEVLWKQDVDLGYSISSEKLAENVDATQSSSSKDEVEKLKALEEIKNDKTQDEPPKIEIDDEWAGIPFTIDNETGEYIRLPLHFDEILEDVLQLTDLINDDQNDSENVLKADSTDSPSQNIVLEVSSPDLSLFNWDDANKLDEIDMMIQTANPFQHHRSGQNFGSNGVFRQTGFHHHHHHQSRVPLTRGVSMEQRLQDIANLFNPMGVTDMAAYPHYHPTHYSYQNVQGISQHAQFSHPPHSVLHNSSLNEISVNQPHYGHNLASAVSSSMHLTNSNHDVEGPGYKMDHDMMYYSNASDLNRTTDGFINSILTDEDLQLMDMGVNESFCGMRMPDNNATSNNSSILGSAMRNHESSLVAMQATSDGMGSAGDRLDASSDSAVSSMGSERVSSLSDGEWGDPGSDSAQDYHQWKYGGPYDYSYSNRLGETTRQPVAQKKHQMFGKRYFQEQPHMSVVSSSSNLTQTSQITSAVKYEYESFPQLNASISHTVDGNITPITKEHHIPLMTNSELKYACSLDFSARPPRSSNDPIGHNHTYTIPQGTGSIPRPQIRDKKQKKEDEHLTRDEKRARSLNIPIAVHDIINLPMDEFNERLSKYDLSENQLSLIRDIRRRGKNKVAAQNCRKRKLDQILSLEDEVKEVRRRKDRLYHEREVVLAERKRIANKFATLHRHVFQFLTDADGNPCSPSQYSLQQAADGSVYLLRHESSKSDNNNGSTNNNRPHSSQGSSPSNSNKE